MLCTLVCAFSLRGNQYLQPRSKLSRLLDHPKIKLNILKNISHSTCPCYFLCDGWTQIPRAQRQIWPTNMLAMAVTAIHLRPVVIQLAVQHTPRIWMQGADFTHFSNKHDVLETWEMWMLQHVAWPWPSDANPSLWQDVSLLNMILSHRAFKGALELCTLCPSCESCLQCNEGAINNCQYIVQAFSFWCIV